MFNVSVCFQRNAVNAMRVHVYWHASVTLKMIYISLTVAQVLRTHFTSLSGKHFQNFAFICKTLYNINCF